MCPVILPLDPLNLQENYTGHNMLGSLFFFGGGWEKLLVKHGGIGSRRKQ